MADAGREVSDRRKSDQEYRTIIQASMDSFWKVGADGRIIDCNEVACAMLGYSRDEMLALSLHDIDLIEDEAKAAEHVRLVIAQGHDRFETRHRRKDGSSIDVEVSAYCVPGAEAPLLFSFSRDISARKITEKALQEMQFFKQAILDAVTAQVAVVDRQGSIIEVNEAWRRFALENTPVPGQLPCNLDVGTNYLEICRTATGFSAEGALEAARGIQDVLEGRIPIYKQEYPCHAPHARRWFLMTVTPLDQEKGGAVVSHHDISAPRLLAEELSQSEAHIRSILRTAPVGIGVLVDRIFNVVNEAFVSMTGYAAEELVGSSARMLYATDEDFEYVGREKYRQIRDSGIGRVETRFLTKDGRIIDVALSSAPVVPGDLSRGVTFTAQEITAIKRAEQERLAHEARQRNTLVREVHHRIKNHLQGVSGMLQGIAREHPEGAQLLEKAIARVRAIAQVYGLQGSRGDARVRLCDLLQTAAEHMVDPVPVICKLPPAGNEAILAPEEAVPLALVINELLTNALKHLVTVDPQRPVLVTLVIEERMACAEIRNGPARLPPDFDFARSSKTGTGLELVAALLPPQGSRLEFSQDGDEVVARLELEVPVITTIIRSA